MSKEDREHISALVDGQVDAREEQSLLDRLGKDAELRAAWGRYHLIGDALRNDLPVAVDTGIAARVSAALEQEPAILAPRRRILQHPKRAAGLAVAASVLGVAVLVGLPQSPEEAGFEPVVAATAPSGSASGQLVSEVPRWDRGQPMIESRLNSYVVNHNEYSASTGMQGMLPYMRIVGMESAERASYEGR
ncbi:sigma-E factor negative regulatory protein [Ectothiorhodospiraceae bacterium 2226]|nr:sigma-E factor negative regulatory protein [Ectothiorhodospiraceae bacterium 2226]